MKKTVGVIIPVYNGEKYIKECIESALDQTCSFDAIVIVDDGSTDGSLEICQQYNGNDGIIVIHQNNAGAAAARNRGMDLIKTDYVLFLDADDMLSNDACSCIKQYVNKEELDILFYASSIIKSDNVNIKISKQGYERPKQLCGETMDGFTSFKMQFPNNYIVSVCMGAYKVSFLRQYAIEFEVGNIYEDRWFFLKSLTDARTVKYIRNSLYIRRFVSNSTSTSGPSKKKMEDAFRSHTKELKFIQENPKWIKEVEFQRYYIIVMMEMFFSQYTNLKREKELNKQYIDYFWSEIKKYIDYDTMNINELCILLRILQQNREYLETSKEQNQLKVLLESRFKEKLSKAFAPEEKIILYGLGKHTDCLKKFIQYFGIYDISKLLYMVSKKDLSMGVNVIEVDELNNVGIDKIILSSKIYQEEMYEELLKRNVPEKKIYKLYGANDSVDAVIIYDALWEKKNESCR